MDIFWNHTNTKTRHLVQQAQDFKLGTLIGRCQSTFFHGLLDFNVIMIGRSKQCNLLSFEVQSSRVKGTVNKIIIQ